MLINGYEIIVNRQLDPMPRMKLAPGDYVSDEMRAKTDAWLLEFFGATGGVDGVFQVNDPLIGRNVMVCNTRTYAEIRRQLEWIK